MMHRKPTINSFGIIGPGKDGLDRKFDKLAGIGIRVDGENRELAVLDGVFDIGELASEPVPPAGLRSDAGAMRLPAFFALVLSQASTPSDKERHRAMSTPQLYAR